MNLFAHTQPCRTRKWAGYLLACVLSLLALWVRVRLDDALGGFPFMTFFLAVGLTTFIGGLGPGIFAAILTGLLAEHYLFGPTGMLAPARERAWIAVGFYWLATGTFTAIVHSMVSAHEAQLRGEAELRALNAELERRVAERTNDLSEALARRAAAEERLSESEELYRHIVELGAQVPWTADANGLGQSVGDHWWEKTGAEPKEFLGHDWLRSVHPDDATHAMETWRRAVASGQRFDCEYRLRLRDGGYRWCRARAAPRFDEDGRIIRWYGTLEDIEEHRQATARLQQVQAELIHVSRLSAMGALASTLAHELNQPLTAIVNYVRGSQHLIADGADGSLPKVRNALAEVDRCAMHAVAIIRRLRQLVGRGNVQRRPENLPNLISEACTIAMVDAATRGVSYRLDLDADATTVLVDRIQIEQVLINLLRNAIDALEGMPARNIVISTSPHSDRFCEVAVRDSGPGIAPAAAARLFEPFNTTKNDGMGIGLSISRTIIEAHGGRIWSDPAEDGGAVLKFTLARA